MGKPLSSLFNSRLRRQMFRAQRASQEINGNYAISRSRESRRAQKLEGGQRARALSLSLIYLFLGFVSEPYRKQTLSCGDNGETLPRLIHLPSHNPSFPSRSLDTGVPAVLINENPPTMVPLSFPLSPNGMTTFHRWSLRKLPSCQVDGRNN